MKKHIIENILPGKFDIYRRFIVWYLEGKYQIEDPDNVIKGRKVFRDPHKAEEAIDKIYES